ncbi:MAG: P1 family peptidase [Patescibacteria group bacterium]
MKTNKNQQKRFRDYGFTVGFLTPGKRNAITDVRGVRVGHATKIQGTQIRTGVTVIDPGVKNLFEKKLPAAISVGNGFGKLAGFTQVEELGTLEAPIVLTNTLAVGPALRGMVDIMLEKIPQRLNQHSVNVVTGETNDAFLNDIRRNVINGSDVARAYKNLSGNVAEGNVGAGTGTRLFSWKGGIGSSSRTASIGKKRFTLGVLVQANFGGALTIAGVPIGAMLCKTNFDSFIESQGDGSCMIIAATDAPLSARQLKRIARRAFLGLARTGSVMSHGSGDYAVAFSTSREGIEGSGTMGACIPDELLTPFFLAITEAVEEGVYNALFMAETMRGRNGNMLEALPVEKVVKILQKNKHEPENQT